MGGCPYKDNIDGFSFGTLLLLSFRGRSQSNKLAIIPMPWPKIAEEQSKVKPDAAQQWQPNGSVDVLDMKKAKVPIYSPLEGPLPFFLVCCARVFFLRQLRVTGMDWVPCDRSAGLGVPHLLHLVRNSEIEVHRLNNFEKTQEQEATRGSWHRY